MQSKSAFLHGLIAEFSKRIDTMKHFARGLDVQKVFNVIQQHPAELRHVLVYNKDELLTPDMFIGVIKTRRHGDNIKGRAYDWFIEYIHSKEPQGLFTIPVSQINTGF